jgi:hypothetical protein
MTKARVAAAMVLVMVGAAACSGSAGGAGGSAEGRGGGGGSATDAFERESVASQAAGEGGGGQAADLGVPRTASRLPTVKPSVIKTGEVRIDVPRGNFRQAMGDVVAIAGRYPGGFVLSTSVAGDEARSGTIVLRVPARSFEQALRAIEDLGKVRSEHVTGQDVTQEFIDLEARLRNFRSQEAVLLRLMDRANTVSDTIRVQGELQAVQLEIERLTGQLRYLEDQTSLGTLTVSLREAGAAAPEPRGVLQRAWAEALENSLGVVAAVIVGAGVAIPVALLILVALLIVRGLVPRLTP